MSNKMATWLRMQWRQRFKGFEYSDDLPLEAVAEIRLPEILLSFGNEVERGVAREETTGVSKQKQLFICWEEILRSHYKPKLCCLGYHTTLCFI